MTKENEDNQSMMPYRSMTAIESKPKKIHGIIPSKVIYPDKHQCSKPTLNRFIRWWFLFWTPSLKYGSFFRCQKCDQVWQADWDFPYSWGKGWIWQGLVWQTATINEWIKAGGDEK
jgi:hypothetical protein